MAPTPETVCADAGVAGTAAHQTSAISTVRGMRRHTSCILALVVAVVAVGLVSLASPAGAHYCTTPIEAPVAVPATITIGAGAEDKPVVGVDITIPPGFHLDRIGTTPGWTAERDGALVRFRGGQLAPFTCVFFSLTGEVAERATLAFPLTAHAADGTTRRYSSTEPGDHFSAQLVYAGTSPPRRGSGGIETLFGPLGWVLVGAGATGGLVLALRRRPRPASPFRVYSTC